MSLADSYPDGLFSLADRVPDELSGKSWAEATDGGFLMIVGLESLDILET